MHTKSITFKITPSLFERFRNVRQLKNISIQEGMRFAVEDWIRYSEFEIMKAKKIKKLVDEKISKRRS
jgi:endonuclease III